MQVKIFTKPKCQPCKLTKMKFDDLGIPYEEVSALEHSDYLQSLGYSAVPVIEVDMGEGATAHWANYRPAFIEQLHATLADKSVSGKVDVPEGQ